MADLELYHIPNTSENTSQPIVDTLGSVKSSSTGTNTEAPKSTGITEQQVRDIVNQHLSTGVTEDRVRALIESTSRFKTGMNVLMDGYLKSQNFYTGVSGWQIDADGNIEGNNGNFRGDITGASGTFSGTITATTGAIGGFNIGADYLKDVADSFGLASTVTGGNDVRFWAGDTFANRATADLRIYEDGSIIGTNANFTGAIFATSGWIGSATALVYESQGINTGTTGFIRGGQTSYNTGTGYFLGYDSGAYKLSIGVSTGDNLTWNGTTLNVAGTFSIGGSVITIDNTKDIQTYLDAINTAGGGTLYLKSGTYTLTSAGLTMYASVALVGTSPTATIIDFNNTAGKITIAGTLRYNTGTITSITNGVTVVGSGTSWAANVVAGRDSFFINGQWMVIAVVTDDTHITLAEGYDGATISAGTAYRISSPIQNIKLSGFNAKNSTGSVIDIDDARYLDFSNIVLQDNNIGVDGNYVTEFAMNGVSPVSNTSHGITVTNGGRFNWDSVNSVVNGGSGIVWNSIRSAGFSTGVGNSNTADGINITSCSDCSFTSFNTNANGGQGVECVSGNTSLSFIDMGATGNTSDGLKLTATTDYTQIIGGDFQGNGGYGINIAASTCDDTKVLSPVFVGNSSGTINDSGTNTTIIPTNYSFSASENLTIGMPVGTDNLLDNSISRAKRTISTVAHSVTTPLFSGANLKNYCPIGGDKFVFLNYTAATSDTLFAQVGSIDKATLTLSLGTALSVATAFTPESTALKNVAICKLDTDKFIVFYVLDSGTTVVKYRVGTVSGTTITFGSEATFFTSGGSSYATACSFASDFLSTDKGVFCAFKNSASDAVDIVFTVSGTVATAGTADVLPSILRGDIVASVKKIGTDKYVVGGEGSGGGQISMVVCTTSGTTITQGTPVNFTSSVTTTGTAVSNFQIISPTTDVYVIKWISSATAIQIAAFTVSTRTITAPAAPLSGGSLSSLPSSEGGIVPLNSTTTYIFTGTAPRKIVKITRSGTASTDAGIVANGFTTVQPEGVLWMDNGYAITLELDSTNINTWIQGMSNNWIGFIQSTINSGSTSNVLVSGVDGNQSGLYPGKYYLINNGTLTEIMGTTAVSTIADTEFVTAISTTQVVI